LYQFILRLCEDRVSGATFNPSQWKLYLPDACGVLENGESTYIHSGTNETKHIQSINCLLIVCDSVSKQCTCIDCTMLISHLVICEL